jgi:two-component system, chemotaxis family, chemotaxis protein CheY
LENNADDNETAPDGTPAPEGAEPTAAPGNTPGLRMQQPHVLVVDDDPDILDALTEALKSEGYSACGARDGIEALHAIAERRPDLVITDLMMPTMTGWELLGALHEDPNLATIPTLIITAARSPEAPKTADGVFRKPLDLDGLLRAISAYTGPPPGSDRSN